jgi:quercetin 2,3-dioxygenase
MKMTLFLASERGFANHGWLKSFHTFSFANYHNAEKMHFGALRVLNDDIVSGGMGFGKHRHDNMEIVSIPLSGALQHEDSEGNKTIINHGDVQIMSAGTGIFHSEKNNSHEKEVKFLQIWVFPKAENIKPNYDQKTFLAADRHNKFQIIVSPDATHGGVHINQDAVFYLANFDENFKATFIKKFANNNLFLMVLEGEITIADKKLSNRDAIGISDFDEITFESLAQNSQLLLIEIPQF